MGSLKQKRKNLAWKRTIQMLRKTRLKKYILVSLSPMDPTGFFLCLTIQHKCVGFFCGGDGISKFNLNAATECNTLMSIRSICWPAGMLSRYFLRSMLRNSNTRYSLFSCIRTSSKLKQKRFHVHN